jgi:hypothetical protein
MKKIKAKTDHSLVIEMYSINIIYFDWQSTICYLLISGMYTFSGYPCVEMEDYWQESLTYMCQ